MPHTQASDVAHGVTTDHSIPRNAKAASPVPDRAELSAFLGEQNDRGLGLAYAEAGDPRARQYLLKAVPADAPVLIRLAALDRDADRAARLYEEALRTEPFNSVALVNLGVLRAAAGRIPEAAKLWNHALETDPAIESAALNLAKISTPQQARVILRRYLEFNPDSYAVRAYLSSIN